MGSGMTGQLVRYETARAALADARSVDEVKDIHDKAAAMTAYARMANDTQLEADASELRLRAERRLGAMIAEQKRTVGLNRGGRPSKTGTDNEPVSVKLADVGIDKKLSARSQKVAGIGEQAFEAVVANVRQRIAQQSGRVSLDVTAVDKKEKRANRERVLAGIQMALPKKKYGVIYADPEWRFEPYSRESGMDRAPENHYPTSELEAICARPVRDIAAPDCVLFLWATVPMLAEAFCVLDAWGFARFERNPGNGFLEIDKKDGRYVSSGSWTKYKPGAGIGLGHWFRVDHELLLVATRGNIPCPAKGTQARSVFDEPASRIHSEKPILVHELIESYFPNLPKIELNARRARPGWDSWGNEAPRSEDSCGDLESGVNQENPPPHAIELQQGPATPDTVGTAAATPRGDNRDVGNVAKLEGDPKGARCVSHPDRSQEPIPLDFPALDTVIGKHGEASGEVHDAPPDDQDGGASASFEYPEMPEFLRRAGVAA
jgi:N6-adenosine-specific RNA methylase IME4